MNREQKLGLLGDVFEITHQGRAVFAAEQVLVMADVGARLEQFGQFFLKFRAVHWFPILLVASVAHAIDSSFRCPVRRRSRSFIRALCSCDLLLPMEQLSMSAISLCS